MDKKIGFIGLGNMGFHMASHLIANNYEVVLFDINESVMNLITGHNVEKANSPLDVANRSDIVLVSLPTPEIVKQVALGENGLIHGKKIEVYIDLSTSGQVISKQVGDELNANGIEVLDSPVSGGVIGAKEATLSLMVSGRKSTLNNNLKMLKKIAKKIFHVGDEPGQGQVMKVINNLLSSAALAFTSESIVLGVKAGLNPKTMIDVLNASSGRNSATEDKFERSILNRKFDYGFSTNLAYKDMKLCMDLAEHLGVPMFLGQNVTHFWRHALSQGGEEKDYTEIIKIFEEWTGVKTEHEEVVRNY